MYLISSKSSCSINCLDALHWGLYDPPRMKHTIGALANLSSISWNACFYSLTNVSLLNSSYAPSTFARVSAFGARMNSVFFIWFYVTIWSTINTILSYMHKDYKWDFLYIKVSDNLLVHIHVTLNNENSVSCYPLNVDLPKWLPNAPSSCWLFRAPIVVPRTQGTTLPRREGP